MASCKITSVYDNRSVMRNRDNSSNTTQFLSKVVALMGTTIAVTNITNEWIWFASIVRTKSFAQFNDI